MKALVLMIRSQGFYSLGSLVGTTPSERPGPPSLETGATRFDILYFIRKRGQSLKRTWQAVNFTICGGLGIYNSAPPNVSLSQLKTYSSLDGRWVAQLCEGNIPALVVCGM